MTDSAAPKLSKWPFVLGDVILVAFGALVVFRTTGPLNAWQFFGALAAIAAGAWLCILPFLREHRAAIKLAEALALADAVTQMQNLQRIQTQIGGATEQWQAIHEMSRQASGDAKQVAGQMKAQLDEFCAFLAKARDAEKDHLKLEVDKLRRAERDWLQAAVIVLDHIFALHTAAVRAGQPGMIAQLSQFQMACRDAMRRLGLNGFAPTAADAFNSQLHQLEDGAGSPDGARRVKEVLAMGYTFQGELVRRALVRTEAVDVAPALSAESEVPSSDLEEPSAGS